MKRVYYQKEFSKCDFCHINHACDHKNPPCSENTIIQQANCNQCELHLTAECPDNGKFVPARSIPCEKYKGPQYPVNI